jgi:hypothetical protein
MSVAGYAPRSLGSTIYQWAILPSCHEGKLELLLKMNFGARSDWNLSAILDGNSTEPIPAAAVCSQRALI